MRNNYNIGCVLILLTATVFFIFIFITDNSNYVSGKGDVEVLYSNDSRWKSIRESKELDELDGFMDSMNYEISNKTTVNE